MGTIVELINGTNAMEETLFPGAKARRQALKTQDYTANYGSPIPLSQGLRRLSGTPIWAGPLTESTVLGSFTGAPPLGGVVGVTPPAISQVTRSVSRSFAIALGYNLAPLSDIDLPKVRRIWVDGTLVYANGSTVQPLWFDPYNNTYGASWNKVPQYSGLLYGAPTGAPPAPMGIGSPVYLDQVQANINFNFYAGTETQLPDAIIVADKGDLTPAYRGMIYLVIKDWVVGTSTQTTMYHIFGDGSDTYGSSKDVSVANTLPKIDVELVDGTITTSSPQDFDLLPEAQPLQFNGENLVPNWQTREICIAMPEGIQTYDMDAKAQTSVAQYTYENPDDEFGSNNEWAGWDALNNVLYGALLSPTDGPYAYLASINKATGVVSKVPYANHFDLGFYDVDGNDPFVTGKPINAMPGLYAGDVGHYIFAGEVNTFICGRGALETSAVVLTVSNDGITWPPSFPAEALSDFASKPLTFAVIPLLDVALENAVPAYQDGAFVMSYGSKVVIVFVKFSREILTDGGTSDAFKYARIVGVQEIYDAGVSGVQCGVLVTSDRNILIVVYPSATGTNQRIARVNLSYDLSPDFASAPGWQGYFPHASEVVFDVDHPDITPFQFSDSLKFNNTQNGRFYVSEKYLISVEDGSVVVDTSALGLARGGSYVWDDSTGTLFGHGNLASGTHNMRYCELSTTLSGSIGALSNYLKWFGLRAGFTAANIQVDSQITDQVVGSIVVTTMDMAQLYNDLGTLYGFTWFVNNGILKFIKSNKAPLKASATLTALAQPVDGQTIVVGSSTYTLKLIPAAPYDVKIDDTRKETTLINLMKAINKAGQDGFEYFSITSANDEVVASCPTDTTLKAIARDGGLAGNTVAVSSSDISKLKWGNATLLGGDVAPTAAINLTVDNMMAVQNGPVGEGAALITTFQSPQSVEQAAAINFYNLDADYTLSTQKFMPDDGSDASGLYNTIEYDIPFVMASAEAYNRITKVAVTTTGTTEVIQEFQLSQQFLRIEPSDIASVTIGTYNYTVRLDEVTINADFTISASGQNYSFRDDIPISTYIPQARTEQTINGPGDGVPVVIDGPFIDPSLGIPDAFVVYSAIRTYGQSGWRSAQMKYNDALLYTAAVDVPYGVTSTALPSTATPFLTDDTALRVTAKTMAASDFANATDDQYYNNENLLVVGKPGRWEYIAFRNITALNSKVFEFSGLARGRRGTDVNTNNHQAADDVYVVRSVASGFQKPLFTQAQGEAEVGAEATYMAFGVPAIRSPSSTTVTFAGEALKPFSPCGLAAALVTGNDIDLSWNRRDRFSTVFITEVPPMSEITEKYDLEILSAGVVKRTMADLTTPAYTYTSADQTTDGFTPPLASLEIRVYQKGVLGRGYPKQETLNVE